MNDEDDIGPYDHLTSDQLYAASNSELAQQRASAYEEIREMGYEYAMALHLTIEKMLLDATDPVKRVIMRLASIGYSHLMNEVQHLEDEAEDV